MKTHREIIRDLGGPSVVGQKTNTRTGTVSQWYFRRRIPRTVWPEFIEAFPEVTFELLKATENDPEGYPRLLPVKQRNKP